ncbi:hypothetical protein OF83DRAFT_1176449 [Amylostereum chailletii]|nr:hypothetical protein OF83DRAFT_1176449 [Amylostereum chailletii]
MPSVYRVVFAAAQAALLAAIFCPLSSTTALANPMPWPMPIVELRGGHLAEFPPTSRAVKSKVPKKDLLATHHINKTSSNAASAAPMHRPSFGNATENFTARPRDTNINSLIDSINILNQHYSQAQGDAQNLKTYASQAKSGNTGPAFNQQSVSTLQSFHSNSEAFHTVFDQLGRNAGLANYDRSNELETQLKDLVNLHKVVLDSVDVLVTNIPVLGPLLGPIVYQIKCILDKVLDTVENVSDALLNALDPLLRPILGDYSTAVCDSALGLDLAGICLL